MSNSDGYETARNPSSNRNIPPDDRNTVYVSDQETNLESDYETGAEMHSITDGEETDVDFDKESICIEDKFSNDEEEASENSLATIKALSFLGKKTKSKIIENFEQIVDETETEVKEALEDFTLIVSLNFVKYIVNGLKKFLKFWLYVTNYLL